MSIDIDRSHESTTHPNANATMRKTASFPRVECVECSSRRSSPKPVRIRSRIPFAQRAPHSGMTPTSSLTVRYTNHRLSNVISAKTMITRTVKNVGLSHTAFSWIVGGVTAHGKIDRFPTKTVSSSSTNATGSHATYPSMNRIVGLDHRAVVMRWDAEIATPADENVVKNSQFTWNASHARAFPVNAPIRKIAKPTIANTRLIVASRFGIGREMI